MVFGYFLVLIFLLINCSEISYASRVTLVQRQACNYVSATKEVICKCRDEDTRAYLGVRMQGFVMKSGQEILSLVVQSCPDLIISLDLRRLNLSKLQTVFRNCKTLRIESIILDKRNAELLRMEFYQIRSLTISGVQVESEIKIKTMNVNKFQLLSSSFANLPTRGLIVNGSAKLEILDCVFEKIHFKSIVVERTRALDIVGNQFGGSGLKILSYRDGSSANIQCNRALGSVVKPECNSSSHNVPTISSTISDRTYSRFQYKSMEELREIGEEDDVDWIVMIVGAALLISIVIYTSYLSYNNVEFFIRLKTDFLVQLGYPIGAAVNDSTQDQNIPLTNVIPKPPPPPEPVETETIVNNSKSGANGKTQTLSPIWLNEIQSNEIFNKQKKITQSSEKSEPEITIDMNKSVPAESSENGSKCTKEFKEYVY